MRYALLVTRIQWIDRKATSAFLVGLTLQNVVTCAAIWRVGAAQSVVLAVRGVGLACVGIVLLAAMSSLQNEFRYGTSDYLVTGGGSIRLLLWLRALGTVVVASPAVVLPLATAAVRSGRPGLCLQLGMLLGLFLLTLGYVGTLLLALVRDPAGAVPWVRIAVLVLGLGIGGPAAGRRLLILPLADQVARGAVAGPGALLTGAVMAALWCAAATVLLSGAAVRRLAQGAREGADAA